MLQGSFAATYGSNGPLWSLAYEWWYYLLFPLMLNMFYGSKIMRFICLSLVVCVFCFLNKLIFLHFPLWGIGAMLVLIERRCLCRKYAILICIIVVFFVKCKIVQSSFVNDILLAGAVAVFINSHLGTKLNYTGFSIKLNQWLANFSYTLYLFHYPFILFLISLISKGYGSLFLSIPSVLNMILFFNVLIAIYIYSYLMYCVFEKNTRLLGGLMFKL
jgi:peptidoglycan/LPS O-acetylase OafA/YrhL